jgi:hypothetical protein
MPTPYATRFADSELAPLVADFYENAPAAIRTRLLSAMLKPVGTLALVAVAAGAFARFLPARASAVIHVSPEASGSISADQVHELARYVEQKSPEVLARLPDLVGNPAHWRTTRSGSQLLAALAALPAAEAT